MFSRCIKYCRSSLNLLQCTQTYLNWDHMETLFKHFSKMYELCLVVVSPWHRISFKVRLKTRLFYNLSINSLAVTSVESSNVRCCKFSKNLSSFLVSKIHLSIWITFQHQQRKCKYIAIYGFDLKMFCEL